MCWMAASCSFDEAGAGERRQRRGAGTLQSETELIADDVAGGHSAHLGERRPLWGIQPDPGLQRAPQLPAGALLVDVAVAGIVGEPFRDGRAGIGVAEDALQQRSAVVARVLGHPRQVGVGELVAAEHLVDGDVGEALAQHVTGDLLERGNQVAVAGLFDFEQQRRCLVPRHAGHVDDDVVRRLRRR